MLKTFNCGVGFCLIVERRLNILSLSNSYLLISSNDKSSEVASGPIKYLILNSIYIAFLILIANIDADSKIIPNKIVIIGTILSVIIFTFNTDSIQDNSKSLILESLSGLSIGFGIMLIFYLLPFTRIGAGDVKLSALMGAISGFPKILFALSSGIIFAGIISYNQ